MPNELVGPTGINNGMNLSRRPDPLEKIGYDRSKPLPHSVDELAMLQARIVRQKKKEEALEEKLKKAYAAAGKQRSRPPARTNTSPSKPHLMLMRVKHTGDYAPSVYDGWLQTLGPDDADNFRDKSSSTMFEARKGAKGDPLMAQRFLENRRYAAERRMGEPPPPRVKPARPKTANARMQKHLQQAGATTASQWLHERAFERHRAYAWSMRPQMSIHKAYPPGYGIDPTLPTDPLPTKSPRAVDLDTPLRASKTGDGRVAARGSKGETIAPPTIHPPATPDERVAAQLTRVNGGGTPTPSPFQPTLGVRNNTTTLAEQQQRPTTYNHHHPLHVLTDVHANTPAASSTMSTSSTKASSTTRARRPASAAPTVPGYHRLTVSGKDFTEHQGLRRVAHGLRRLEDIIHGGGAEPTAVGEEEADDYSAANVAARHYEPDKVTEGEPRGELKRRLVERAAARVEAERGADRRSE